MEANVGSGVATGRMSPHVWTPRAHYCCADSGLSESREWNGP